MRLAIFGAQRLGVVTGDGVADVTGALPWPHDADPLTAGWWRRLCRDFEAVRPALAAAARGAAALPLAGVSLAAPVLNPSKIIAVASNYAGHVSEMHDVQRRTLGRVESWMMEFDVFLKAPSAVTGPAGTVVLPPAEVAAGHEIHHEAELAVVVGPGGKDIPPGRALGALAGYTIGLDITVRGAADRSRRKSYDTFCPLGPWLTTSDEVGDPASLRIELERNGVLRQQVSTSDMLVSVADLVAYASSVMTLLPGDVILTGAPPGVGPIAAGDKLRVRIGRLGEMELSVR
ncbi:MAG: fumarylacetoacetate hydrolase family protein [Streptosporangiaceae bacterium]|nr:fumarylacetoacetate hydrolase family protein [Streptosporangiaceae bacterium]